MFICHLVEKNYAERKAAGGPVFGARKEAA
jgi:hypothetical protein